MTELAAGDDGALGFPDGFTWGAATAAYQIEGAAARRRPGPPRCGTPSATRQARSAAATPATSPATPITVTPRTWPCSPPSG